MPLTITEEHKSKLALLLTQDSSVTKEFCRLATLFLQQDVNPRVFSSAANKLGVQPSQVEDAIQALVFLFSESTRASVSQEEFNKLSSSLGFPSNAVEALTNAYSENRVHFREYLNRMGVQAPHYQNLEWRFDILVGSRSLHHIAEPLLTLQLSLDCSSSTEPDETQKKSQTGRENSKVQKLLLQTDANNLTHMTTVLEEALQEARTHHSRRIHRHFK